MMKLYWAPRTRSLRALWVLEEAGVHKVHQHRNRRARAKRGSKPPS